MRGAESAFIIRQAFPHFTEGHIANGYACAFAKLFNGVLGKHVAANPHVEVTKCFPKEAVEEVDVRHENGTYFSVVFQADARWDACVVFLMPGICLSQKCSIGS
jgi:microcompartment protein CcmL/EutN